MPRALALALLVAGCGGEYLVRGHPPAPLDVAVVPGCPCEEDGALSPCQKGRALWAAELWRRGDVRAFIASGGAVHSPYFEADAIAAAMVALGVPPDRIWLERDALHTDENMFYARRLAHALGFKRIAVASSRGQAYAGCQFLVGDGEHGCALFAMELPAMQALASAHPGVLDGIRARRVDPWLPVAEQERRIRARTGRSRPPSWALYPWEAWLKLWGRSWIPPGVPGTVRIVNYRDALGTLVVGARTPDSHQ